MQKFSCLFTSIIVKNSPDFRYSSNKRLALLLFRYYSLTSLVDVASDQVESTVTPAKQGTRWYKFVTSMKLDRAIPIPVPNRVEAVNWETVLPQISPILLFLANWRLILALEAEANSQQTFLPTLASEAIKRKQCGNFKARISIQHAKLRVEKLRNRHFLTSASKFLPYRAAKMIEPNCPIPSLNTHQ